MKSLRFILISFIAGVVCAFGLVLLYFTIIAPERSLPKLGMGTYLGRFSWDELRGHELPNTFLLEVRGENYWLSWEGMKFEGRMGSFVELTDSSDRVMPLQLQVESGNLLLYGSEEYREQSATRLSGEVVETRSGRTGLWELTQLPEEQVEIGDKSLQSERAQDSLYLTLLSEEEQVGLELERQQIMLQENLADIAELEERLSKEEELRAEGAARKAEVEQKLQAIVSEKKVQLKELRELAKQREVALEVTKVGEFLRLTRVAQQLEEEMYFVERYPTEELSLPPESVGGESFFPEEEEAE